MMSKVGGCYLVCFSCSPTSIELDLLNKARVAPLENL